MTTTEKLHKEIRMIYIWIVCLTPDFRSHFSFKWKSISNVCHVSLLIRLLLSSVSFLFLYLNKRIPYRWHTRSHRSTPTAHANAWKNSRKYEPQTTKYTSFICFHLRFQLFIQVYTFYHSIFSSVCHFFSFPCLCVCVCPVYSLSFVMCQMRNYECTRASRKNNSPWQHQS